MCEGAKETLVYHRAKTDLGKRLSEIRSKIVASGKPLLDWDNLEKELADRRGEKRGRDDEKADLR